MVLFSVVSGTVVLSGGAAAAANVGIEDGVAYPDGDGTSIELRLNDAVANGLDGNGDLEVYVDGSDVSGTAFDSVVEDGSSERVEIALDSRVTPNRNLTVKLTDVGGGSVTEKDITVASRTLTVDSAERSYPTVYSGEVVAIEAPDATADRVVEFETESGELLTHRGYDENSHVYVYDTSDLETGQRYDVEVGSETVGFEIDTLDLAVEAEESNVTEHDDIVAQVSTVRGATDVEATLLDSDGDEVDGMVRALDGSPPFEFDFGPQTAADGSVVFAEDTVVEQRGDVAEITYRLSGTSDAFVVVGDEAESNYAIEGHITDADGDGEVTVRFNSYLAGVPNSGNDSVAASDVLAVSGGDEITAVRERGSFERSDLAVETLDTGAYELSAAAGTSEPETPDNVGTLQLEDRRVDSVSSWVAPRDTDLTSGDIYDRIGTNLTRADEIAEGDVVVHRVDASGIEGALDYRTDVVGASNATAAVNQSRGTDGFTLSVDRRTDPPNAEPASFRLNTSNMVVVEDATNDTYFVAVELAEVNYERGDPVRDGDEDQALAATFSLSEHADLADDEATTNYTVIDRDAQFGTTDGQVTVEAAASQSVTGTTTIAPGSEVEVQLESQNQSSPFLRRPVATVGPDGTFTASTDMSESDSGVNFTVELVDVDGDSFDADEDGRIVAAPAADETGSENVSGATTDVEPGDEALLERTEASATPTATDEGAVATATTQREPGTTTASGPGFTIVVALVAVVAGVLAARTR